MPKFEVTSPDGKVYEITAPEGATEQQAIEYAQQVHAAETTQPQPTQPTQTPAEQPAPNDYRSESLKQSAELARQAVAVPIEQAAGKWAERIGETAVERYNRLQQVQNKYQQGQIDFPQALLRGGAATIGFVPDVYTDTAKSIYEQIPTAVKESAIGRAVGETYKDVTERGRPGAVGLIGEAVSRGGEAVGQGIQYLAQKYPETAPDIAAAAEILGGAYTLKGVGQAALRDIGNVPGGQYAQSVMGATEQQAGAQAAEGIIPPAPKPEIKPKAGEPITPESIARNAELQKAMDAKNAEDAFNLGKIIQKASSGDQKAFSNLVQLANVDVDAYNEALKLGINLPPDVYSKNRQFQEMVGVIRSQAGSAESAQWKESLANAADEANAVLRRYDANFLGDTPSPAYVSDKIKESLLSTREKVKTKASNLYNEVNQSVGRGTKVEVPKFKQIISQEIEDKLGEKNLSALEQGLNKKFSGEVSYAMLDDTLKDLRMADKNVGIYRDINSYTRQKYINALAADKLEAVSSIAGIDAKDKLLFADQLTKQKKELQDRIIKYYGENHSGSIANAIDGAIKEASQAGSKRYFDVMAAIPKEFQKEALATSIANLIKSSPSSVEAGAFGFANYTKLYKGLRANPKIMADITKVLGKGSAEALQGLYKISNQLTSMVRPTAIVTGRPYVKDFERGLVNAESFLNRAMDTKAGFLVKPGVKYGSTAVGAFFGGVPGALATQSFGSSILEKAGQASTAAMQAAAKLLNSAEFQGTIKMVAQNPDSMPFAAKKLSRSKIWRDYTKALKFKASPMEWEDYLKTGGGAVLATQAEQNQQQQTGMQ